MLVLVEFLSPKILENIVSTTLPPFFVISTFPARHGARAASAPSRHKSCGAQTKGVDLIYGLLVMPPALGLVEFFKGGQVVSARGHGARSVIFDARICVQCTDDYT